MLDFFQMLISGIVVGSIFIGGVHDFGSLAVSIRHRARSIAQVALAYIGRLKGYHVIICMSELMSDEHKQRLRALGAELVLTPAAEGMRGATTRAEEILASDDPELAEMGIEKRHEEGEMTEREKLAREWGIPYLDLDGDVGMFPGGAGFGIMGNDFIHYFGGKPANFMDSGGGPKPERLAQMLVLAKRLGDVSAVANAAGDWGRPSLRTDEDTFAYDWSRRSGVRPLYEQTVGILGFGEIGAELARRVQGFCPAAVLYHKRSRLPEHAEQDLGITYAPMEQVIAETKNQKLYTEQRSAMITRKSDFAKSEKAMSATTPSSTWTWTTTRSPHSGLWPSAWRAGGTGSSPRLRGVR